MCSHSLDPPVLNFEGLDLLLANPEHLFAFIAHIVPLLALEHFLELALLVQRLLGLDALLLILLVDALASILTEALLHVLLHKVGLGDLHLGQRALRLLEQRLRKEAHLVVVLCVDVSLRNRLLLVQNEPLGALLRHFLPFDGAVRVGRLHQEGHILITDERKLDLLSVDERSCTLGFSKLVDVDSIGVRHKARHLCIDYFLLGKRELLFLGAW